MFEHLGWSHPFSWEVQSSTAVKHPVKPLLAKIFTN